MPGFVPWRDIITQARAYTYFARRARDKSYARRYKSSCHALARYRQNARRFS